MNYLTHKTKDGDRWDLLAFEYYGNAFAIELLLETNLGLANMAILPSGLTLRVPLVNEDALNPEVAGVVAWR
jgi:phage tail protein X